MKGSKSKIKETYHTKNKTKDRNKILVNEIIGKQIDDYPQYSKGTAVILDTENLLTTKTLIKYGYNRKRIDIVNCVKETYARIKAKHVGNCYNMFLSEYIHMIKEDKGSISTAFFDYCCSTDGNATMKPLIDIQDYFNLKLPSDGSLFAVTLCFRGNKSERGMYEALTKVDKTITHYAHRNGYIALKEDGLAYKGGMFFVMYHIIHSVSFSN